MFTKSNVAKIVAWVGAAIATLALNNAFGKYSAVAGTVASGFTALAAHLASNTSAVHPNG
jgi:hypothetical protein